MDESWFELAPNPTYAVYGTLIALNPKLRSLNCIRKGVEYMPDPQQREAAFINWVGGGQRTWGLTGQAIGADSTVMIGQRLVSEEPMAMVLNLGLSSTLVPPPV